ncbi:MAG: extracellular solute-binding protein [Parcubacteria group bacterium]|jgi:ABC-type glycerol-3-phosphate transport system substrate-binding protein
MKIKKIAFKQAKTIVAFAFVASLFVFSGCGLKTSNPAYKVDLEIWGVFDNSESLDNISNEYKKLNPHIGEIKYRKFTIDSYNNDLINALASGQSPDIFWIGNTWIPSYKDKIEPAPDWLINENEYRNNFVDVAAQDFLSDKRIYAVPLSVDSLALYYNKDIFNAASITTPPRTWDEFNKDIKKITRIDQFDNITQAGAAMGTAYNINRATDILSLIMFQNGVQMTNSAKTEATFDKFTNNASGQSVRAGESALEFYTQFSKRNSSVYTWNPRMHYSVDAFYEGTAAMMINYSWQYSAIKNKNSKLNFAIAQVPQLSLNNPVNYANYWAMAVSKNKVLSQNQKNNLAKNGLTEGNYNQTRIFEAWQFLKYLTFKNNESVTLVNSLNGNQASFPTKFDPADTYLKDTVKPAARRDLIEKQKNDVILGAFAYGNLIAKSWYQRDSSQTENILAEMIDSVNLGKQTVYEALNIAASRVSVLMRK